MENLSQKRLPDDVVQYYIYLSPGLLVDKNIAIENVLNIYLEKCRAFVLKETVNYIWQNECFYLHVASNENLPCLTGTTNFADCIDDEWFILYLLQRITKEFPGLVASVNDSDGQFILIEAAEHIPKWLTPDCSKNRVFFADGLLHLLVRPDNPGQIPFSPLVCPTVHFALDLIYSFPSETLASENVANCINKRTCSFPDKAFDNIQLTNVFIPKNLVYVFDQNPNFISKCVHEFYYRDPIDLRSCRIFKYMLPEHRVWCQIPMTRQHYAQLMQQDFTSDKRSGFQISSNLSAAENKAANLGMKIAHGCEIFLSRFKQPIELANDAETAFDEKVFLTFVESLKSMGYFGDELEGSKLYQHLINQAKVYFVNNLRQFDKNSESGIACLRHQVGKLLESFDEKNVDDVNQAFLQKLQIASNISDLPAESPDEWMYLDEDDLNQIAEKMNEGFSSLHKKSENFQKAHYNQEANQLKQTVRKMNKFVNDQSDFSGIDINDNSSIKFDAKEFLNSLEEFLQINPSKNADNETSSDDDLTDEFLSSDEETETFNHDTTESFCDYLQHMDDELANTSVGKSFASSYNMHSDTESKTAQPNINADVNLLENFLVGRNEENISSGPISNILNSIGADLPN